MLTSVDATQEPLPLKVVREQKTDISDELIAGKGSLREAVKLCAELAPINDDVLCRELDIDPGQWTRIKNGQAHFPLEKYGDLMDVCGNEVPLRWLAQSRGYGLVRLKSAVEAELQAEREKTAALEMKLKHFEEFSQLGGRS